MLDLLILLEREIWTQILSIHDFSEQMSIEVEIVQEIRARIYGFQRLNVNAHTAYS